MSSTAHLPKPADPAQMSEWRRTAFTVEAVVYYPKRMIIGVVGEGRGWRWVKRDSDRQRHGMVLWDSEYEACKTVMLVAGVEVKA